nr:leucine-rich repeat-containing protein 52-like [Anolis sagrei ordinatus]
MKFGHNSKTLWSNGPIEAQPPTTPCPALCICEKWTVNCRRKNLYEIPDNIPPTARYMILAENHFANIQPLEITFLNELLYLDWSDNELEMDYEFIFPGISKLAYLDLSGNKLNAISPHTFSELNRLVFLNLSRNPTIKQIDPNSFISNSLLTYLDISTCSLEIIDISVFEKVPTLRVLRMTDNSWYCDCALLDFINWMNMPLLGRELLDPEETICHLPKNLTGKPIMEAEAQLDQACILHFSIRVLIFAGLMSCAVFLAGVIAAWLLGVVSVLYNRTIFRTEEEGEYRGIK